MSKYPESGAPSVPPPTMATDTPRASGPSKVLGVLDLLIKLIGVGALFGILVMLLQINQELRKTITGNNIINVRALPPTDRSPFHVETLVSNSLGDSISVELTDQRGSATRPFYITNAN